MKHSFLVLAIFVSPWVQAENPAPSKETKPRPRETLARTKRVGLAFRYDSLSNNYPSWRGIMLQGGWVPSPKTTLRGEFSRHERFNDSTTYMTAGVTQVLTKAWYMDLDGAVGFGGFFLPKYRGDLYVSKKWLEFSPLITRFGFMVDKAQDDHSDFSPAVGLTYYFPLPWIVEGGFRLNFSYPGAAQSYNTYIAGTFTGFKKVLLVGRFAFGTEAYQVLDASSLLVDFNSMEASLLFKYNLGLGWGLDVATEYYHNPYYDRKGGRLGFSYEF